MEVALSFRSAFQRLFDKPEYPFKPTVPPAPVQVDMKTLEVVSKADPERKYSPNNEEASSFIWINNLAKYGDSLPAWGQMSRDRQLRELWKIEPILAGAMASMTMKMISLGWKVTGSKNRARRMSRVLADANDGAGWSDFIAKYTQDFLSQDKGAFTELGKSSKGGSVEAIWNIDSQEMLLRRDKDFPYWYVGANKMVKVPRDDVFRAASMPSPMNLRAGLGFCAVSRSAKAARLLITLHDYDADKLSSMPPQGIAAISGMTERQVIEALGKYKLSLDQKSLIYPGVLWLASMTGQLKVDMVPFSTLPDAFSRQEVVPLYVYTLALDFGVDAREFWPAAVAGATRADALVQAMKAKGKGPGELISVTERGINTSILPEGVTFAFDFTDDDEDALKADIDYKKVQTIYELYSHSYQVTDGAPIISLEEAREMLARQGILPREIMANPEEIIGDTGGFRSNRAVDLSDKVVVEFHGGILEETDFTRRYFIMGSGLRSKDKNGNGHKPEELQQLNEMVEQVIH